jgi:hypothetical protein
MCLVLEWSTGFLAPLMALVLSHMRGTWEHSSPKSLSVYVIQSSWEQQLAAATYLASVVHWATLDCLREDQKTNEEPKNWQVPEVDFLLTRHPAKSASEKPRSEREEDVEYQIPSRSVSKIPEDLFDGLPMWSLRRRLKTSTQTHRKLDVRPHHRQV